MKMSDKGREILIRLEGGHRLKAYLDNHGIPTIGVGMTFYPCPVGDHEKGEKVKITDEFSQTASDICFIAMLESFESFVDSVTNDNVTQNQFDALVSFTYNAGQNGYSISDLRARVNKSDFSEGTEREFFDWITVGQKYDKGLIWRRHVEANLFMGRI